MATKPPTDDSAEQARTERRRADRERLRHAAEQLLSPEGWMRWVLARATFSGYSANNCMLLAQQCHERGIPTQRVAGLRAWHKAGRRVRKGEKALRISVPVRYTPRGKDGEESGETRVFFRMACVFAFSQTDPLPGAKPRGPRQRCEPLHGSSHMHLLAPLGAFAQSLGYSVSFTALAGTARGWCDFERRSIRVDARAPANTQVRILIHECVHALGIDYERYGRNRAEVIADTVTFIACAGIGLAVDAESVPYVASWGDAGALAAVTESARTIDRLARRIEDAALRPAKCG
jgi:hypothetical protein